MELQVENLRENRDKFDVFLEVARGLNKEFNVMPVLYGSLGLNLVVGEFTKSGDIDILVKRELVKEDWGKLMDFMKSLGFELKDEWEHEFSRKGCSVAFAKEDILMELAGIDAGSLTEIDFEGARFRIPTAEQFLTIYQLMDRDEYRKEKRGKEDMEKVDFLKKYLGI